MRRFAFAALATLAATAALSAPASAQAVAWSTPASACVITQGADLIEAGSAKISFKPGRTGMAVLSCPVSHVRYGAAPSTTNLGGAIIHYQDSTVTNPGASVRVRMTATSLTNGLSQTLGQFSSDQANTPGPLGVTVNLNASGFILDFDRFVYNVTIVLVRSNASQSVAISGVALRHPVRIPPAV
jgi:hypothetical protein